MCTTFILVKRKEKEQPQKKKEQPQKEKNRKRTEKGSFRDVASTKTKTAYRGGIGAKLDPWD